MEKKLKNMAGQTGRAAEELVQEVVIDYLEAAAIVRETLDSRYDDLKSGRVKPIDGEVFFETLRKR